VSPVKYEVGFISQMTPFFIVTAVRPQILHSFNRLGCEEIPIVSRLLVAASVVSSSPILVTLMKEALGSSETSLGFYKSHTA
jgi:hypothetical protein